MSDKKWEILYQGESVKGQGKKTAEGLLKILLENRGIKTQKECEEFLKPDITLVTPKAVGIDQKQLEKAIKRIEKAIKNKEHIVVFGDYDVDGITASAILWETLNVLGANVMPYIPHRIDEGYGLSVKAIQNSEFKIQNVKLVITVDNGIVANAAVDYANSLGIDVIITDHHVPEDSGSANMPKAYAIIHTTQLCGAGVAWILSKALKKLEKIVSLQVPRSDNENDYLAFAALGTIADLVPLTKASRAIVKEGLIALQQTKRPGILAICKESGIEQNKISTWEVGRIIAPRLNAMGRLENAMDSLRLLCTKNPSRANDLAALLSLTNKERQELTKFASEDAASRFRIQDLRFKNLLFIADESYQQGIIGLVAGRLVEEFYRPAIVISRGEKHSKASARSVHGFNLIEFIRSASDLLVDVGGHPMAAGFTVETEKIDVLQQTLEKLALTQITEVHLTRSLRIDCEIAFSLINDNLYRMIQMLSPFGMGNPEPTFVTQNITIEDIRFIGAEKQHVKLQVFQENSEVFETIGFGMAEQAKQLSIGDQISIVYTIDKNTWNGTTRMQLKLKDIKVKLAN